MELRRVGLRGLRDGCGNRAPPLEPVLNSCLNPLPRAALAVLVLARAVQVFDADAQAFDRQPDKVGAVVRGVLVRVGRDVLTYHAWRALGRQVRRGEHGVKVCTFGVCRQEQRLQPGRR